ncbi:hypothetical protein CDAR_439661 [Caerostris darwini]|uniref:Uncharacterized protein n=1 Tax=Caerostris darwini TaxID=1538125 RepID=A0AAV4RYM9_9ARAC|nr:hypothetical protein CDAR_439661 [Caerostris darwini]
MSGCEENPDDFLFFCSPEVTDVPFPSPESSAVIMSISTLSEERTMEESVLFIDAEVAYRRENRCSLSLSPESSAVIMSISTLSEERTMEGICFIYRCRSGLSK